MDNNQSFLDTTYLQEIYGGDSSILQIMFETFLEDSLITWKEILSAIKNEDFKKVAELTHQVKPSFAMVGLTKLHSDVKDFESFTKANPKKEIILNNYLILDSQINEAKEIIELEITKMKQ